MGLPWACWRLWWPPRGSPQQLQQSRNNPGGPCNSQQPTAAPTTTTSNANMTRNPSQPMRKNALHTLWPMTSLILENANEQENRNVSTEAASGPRMGQWRGGLLGVHRDPQTPPSDTASVDRSPHELSTRHQKQRNTGGHPPGRQIPTRSVDQGTVHSTADTGGHNPGRQIPTRSVDQGRAHSTADDGNTTLVDSSPHNLSTNETMPFDLLSTLHHMICRPGTRPGDGHLVDSSPKQLSTKDASSGHTTGRQFTRGSDDHTGRQIPT